jgi:hypothetical protein
VAADAWIELKVRLPQATFFITPVAVSDHEILLLGGVSREQGHHKRDDLLMDKDSCGETGGDKDLRQNILPHGTHDPQDEDPTRDVPQS